MQSRKKSISSIPVSKSDVVVFLIETDENSIIQDLPKLFFIEFLAGDGARRRNRGVSRTNRWL